MSTLTRTNIEPTATYALKRLAVRKEMIALKSKRRVFVGPYAIFHFECFETLKYQIQEMLFIEKGGDAQLEDELEAYAPLVPNGQELVATLMFEIEDKGKRDVTLGQLGGIEHQIFIQIGSDKVMGTPETDTERSIEGGRTASVHFLHFKFTPAQIAAFKTSDVILGFDHPLYGHMAKLSEATRAELARDFE